MSNGVFVGPGRAQAIIESARRGTHEGFEVNPESGCWEWQQRDQEGRGPWHAFAVAAFGEAPDGFRWVHLCGRERHGCVRPAHLDLLPFGAPPPDPEPTRSDREDFRAAIAAERMVRRDRLSLARQLGVSVQTLRRWETGREHPGLDVQRQVQAKLGWDGKPRRWLVTVVMQRTVSCAAAAQAAQRVMDELAADGQPRKMVIHNVREVG